MVSLASPTQTIAALAQVTAQRLGIKKYDLGGAKIDEVSVQVQQGEPKQVKASQRSGITVRVWNERGQMGITSTTDLDERGLELALGMARDASQFGVAENIPDFSPEATASLSPVEPVQVTLAPANLLLETLIRAEKVLLESHPAISSVPYNGLSQRQVEHFYLNSDGANRHQADSSTSIYLYSKTDQAGRKPRSAGAFRLSHGLDTLDIDGCIQETADKTASHLEYQPIVSKAYPVVFSPEAILSLIAAFSNLFNAQSILDRQSLSNPDSLNQAIASSLINLYDDALHPENLSPPQFDGEGTPTRRIPLIEQGILRGLLHSAGTAKRMAAHPTGHANLGAKVTVSSHFYDLLPGTEVNSSYDRHQANDVVWIDDLHALHAGVKALQGSFSLPFDGWLLRGGEKISIESATVAGDIRTLLKTIEYLEPTAEFSRYGMAPYVWVAPLAITGDHGE